MKKRLIYPQWRAERGIPQEYTLLEFVDYVKDRNTVVKFMEKGIEYIGEIWEAAPNERGYPTKQVIFRVENYILDRDDESSVYIFSTVVPDNWANPVVDEPEFYDNYLNSSSYTKREAIRNKELDLFAREQDLRIYKLIEFLNKIDKESELYKLGSKKLAFMTSPDLYNARTWQRIPKRLKEKLTKYVNS